MWVSVPTKGWGFKPSAATHPDPCCRTRMAARIFTLQTSKRMLMLLPCYTQVSTSNTSVFTPQMNVAHAPRGQDFLNLWLIGIKRLDLPAEGPSLHPCYKQVHQTCRCLSSVAREGTYLSWGVLQIAHSGSGKIKDGNPQIVSPEVTRPEYRWQWYIQNIKNFTV